MSRGTVTKYVDNQGRTRWRFRVDIAGGRGSRRQTKRQGFRTRQEAFDALDALVAEHEGIEVRTDDELITYLRKWVEGRRESGAIKQSTADTYRERIERLGTVTPDGLALVDTRAVHLDDAYRALRRQGAGPRGIRAIYAIVRKALNDAVQVRLIARNPAVASSPPSVSSAAPAERKIWGGDAGRAFMAWDGLPDNRRAAWSVVLGTGVRCSELAGIRWEDLDADGVLHIRRARYVDRNRRVHEERPKTAAAIRDIPLHPATITALAEWRATQTAEFERLGLAGGSPHIVTSSTWRPANPNDLTRRWLHDTRAALAAGVVSHEMTLHDGRHWFATQLVAAGVDMRTAAALLGHTDPGFTLRTYGHTDTDRTRAATAALEL